MTRLLRSLGFGAACLLTSCASARPVPAHTAAPESPPPPPGPPPKLAEPLEDGLLRRTSDLNGDGKPDDTKVTRPGAPDAEGRVTETLVRREVDTNFDGKPDLVTLYGPGEERLTETFDLDFDGLVDVTHVFEKGALVRKITRGLAGAADQITLYADGKKLRVERDARRKGRIDTWEYYEGGTLDRVGLDDDGDGAPDRWIRP